jgi:hypothetical protein
MFGLFYRLLLRKLRLTEDLEAIAYTGHPFFIFRFKYVSVLVYREKETTNVVAFYLDNVAQKFIRKKVYKTKYYNTIYFNILKSVKTTSKKIEGNEKNKIKASRSNSTEKTN